MELRDCIKGRFHPIVLVWCYAYRLYCMCITNNSRMGVSFFHDTLNVEMRYDHMFTGACFETSVSVSVSQCTVSSQLNIKTCVLFMWFYVIICIIFILTYNINLIWNEKIKFIVARDTFIYVILIKYICISLVLGKEGISQYKLRLTYALLNDHQRYICGS